MGIQGKTPPDFRDLREEARRIGRNRDLVFRVLLALVVGSCFAILAYLATDDPHDRHRMLLPAGMLSFVGGYFTGWIVEFEVRHRRWRLLWLAVSSPATSVWLYAVWITAMQRHINGFDAILLTIMFVSALVGSAVGYRAVYRHRMRERRG